MSKVFVHPNGLNESKRVGAGTRVWAFAHVLPGAVVGKNCNICDHVFIENGVTVGDNVTVKCGVQLWTGITVGNNVFIGPNATFTNDAFPRSKKHLSTYPETVLEDGCSIGANATILPGLRIGRNAMVGAGGVVTQSVPPFAIVTGNPARITGYVGANGRLKPPPRAIAHQAASGRQATRVRGVTLCRFAHHADMRGEVGVFESSDLPFAVKRHFYVYNVPSPEVRGQHAHRKCHQLLVCLSGSCSVVADDGLNREEFTLADKQTGLHLPPLIWSVQYRYSADAVLLVLASHRYDPNDYIRDYDSFLALRR
jgi:acetyltransferase-like isoleucine patch superfamily enzyme/dTDP-4-dehydrorhamnose 3,5-epimerase-like enzyme